MFDLVLGDGAHPDPAREMASAGARAIAEASDAGRRLDVIAVVVGTDQDPQGLDSQARRLEEAGIHVTRGNEEAIALAAGLVSGLVERERPSLRLPVPLSVLDRPASVLSVGLEWFASSLAAQGVQALQVAWRPPAGGDVRLVRILQRMEKE